MTPATVLNVPWLVIVGMEMANVKELRNGNFMERHRPTAGETLRPARQVSSAHDMPKEHEIEDKPLRIPTFKADVFGIGLLAFACGFGIGWGLTNDIRIGVGTGATVALIVIVWRAWSVLDKPVSHFRETTWQQAWADLGDDYSPTLVQIPGHNGTVIEFRQPQSAEFANWTADILATVSEPMKDRVTYSQNTARARGWSSDMYKSMLSSLRLAGWVIRNGQYWVPSTTGIRYLDAWMKNRQSNGD